jgi:hypothetical protein
MEGAVATRAGSRFLAALGMTTRKAKAKAPAAEKSLLHLGDHSSQQHRSLQKMRLYHMLMRRMGTRTYRTHAVERRNPECRGKVAV